MASGPAPDGSVWGIRPGNAGARLVRFVPGSHPPETALAEVLRGAMEQPEGRRCKGFAPRGMDVDSKGVVWAPLSRRTLCQLRPAPSARLHSTARPPRDNTAPKAGRSIHSLVPNYKGAVENGSADSAYYNFVDRFRHARVSARTCRLRPATCPRDCWCWWDGKFMTLRVPYPMGYYAKRPRWPHR